jgi:hypothetical protein
MAKAAAKPKAPVSDKLNIGNEMRQFDLKNRGFYDDLTDEEKKKFSNFLMIRWGSAVDAPTNVQSYYVMSCNENLNRHFFDLGRHPKLQWLLATTVSPGIGVQRHQWIAPKKKEGSDSRAAKFLRNLFPHLKEDEIDILRRINDTDDLRQLARKHGWEEKRIKDEL